MNQHQSYFGAYNALITAVNGIHGAEPIPTQAPQHEPCGLAHMILAAVRLWHDRHGEGMPEDALYQAVLFDWSPVRIHEVIYSLIWSGELRQTAECYWPVGIPLTTKPPPVLQVADEEPSPYLRNDRTWFIHTRQSNNPLTTCCGVDTTVITNCQWKESASDTGHQCGHCRISKHQPLAPFGG